MDWTNLFILVQFACTLIMGLYFFNQLKGQKTTRTGIERSSEREMQKLRVMRSKRLTQPLSEKTRPQTLKDIVGQEEGIKALKAALCCANPQHVLIYGPPGVGKTCAARLMLEEAKNTPGSPFEKDAKFVEIDATCVRFDERSIADPLIGSVHDPIYQGAGSMGAAGIPQPKPGAVSKANGGVLFLDEIGELHPIQMNKLLKVLEDRKVHFESAYYSPEDPNIPMHIREIFEHGLPADFRLVGATTRQPTDIPPAIRSRCLEIFFRALRPGEIVSIARGAAEKSGVRLEPEAARTAAKFCENGREVVNMIQLAAGTALSEGRQEIETSDIEWVAETCRYKARFDSSVPERSEIGCANGLAVTGDGQGMLLGIEVIAQNARAGSLCVTGIVEEEELESGGRHMKRKSTARSSVENVLTALRLYSGIDARKYELFINFPGGMPVDGPSAGTALAAAVASAILQKPCDHLLALTGEISIRGKVLPVGGVHAKIEAAVSAGAKRVLIPKENYRPAYDSLGARIIPVSSLGEVLELALQSGEETRRPENQAAESSDTILAAKGANPV